MKIEALLPLGKLDPGLRAVAAPLDIARVGEDARLAEELGYDGIVTEETKEDPFDRMLVAQAIVADMTIVSTDEILSAYGVARLW